jgi:DNA-binding IclR family transcriptional regulator
MSSLENGLALLALLGPARPVLRVGEVARDLALPKASVSRLLRSLAVAGLLEREADGPGYLAGPRAMLLGKLYAARTTLLQRVDAALEELVTTFGFTGFASVLSGRDIVLLLVKQGSYPLRYVREVGVTLPSWRTTMGTALLSRLPEAEIRDRFKGHPDGPDVAALIARLAPLRTARSIEDTSVLTPGIVTISTVVGDPRAVTPIAMALAFPGSAADAPLHRRMAQALEARQAQIAAAASRGFPVTADTPAPPPALSVCTQLGETGSNA